MVVAVVAALPAEGQLVHRVVTDETQGFFSHATTDQSGFVAYEDFFELNSRILFGSSEVFYSSADPPPGFPAEEVFSLSLLALGPDDDPIWQLNLDDGAGGFGDSVLYFGTTPVVREGTTLVRNVPPTTVDHVGPLRAHRIDRHAYEAFLDQGSDDPECPSGNTHCDALIVDGAIAVDRTSPTGEAGYVFTNFFDVRVSASGLVVFDASIFGDGQSRRGVYAIGSTPTVLPVAIGGQGSPFGTWGVVRDPVVNREGLIVFWDVGLGLFGAISSGADFWPIAPESGPGPQGTYQNIERASFAGAYVAFRADVIDADQLDPQCLLLSEGFEPAERIACVGDPAPDTGSTFASFASSPPLVDACGSTAFVAEVDGQADGLFLFDGPGSGQLVAQVGSSADFLGYPGRTLDAAFTSSDANADGGGSAALDGFKLLWQGRLDDGVDFLVESARENGSTCRSTVFSIFADGFESGDASEWL